MKARFSLLLLSILFATGCVHDQYVTGSEEHFGMINAVCKGMTAEDCLIKTRLEVIENSCHSVERHCCSGNDLLNELFGETRHTKFANYIVFFDQDHTPGRFEHHQPVLMWNRRNTRYLYGVQEVYILLFTQYKACFTAYGTTLVKNEANPFDFLNLINKGAPPAIKEAGLQTRAAEFAWYPLSGDPDEPGMWLAIASVPVDVNTADWITVRYSQPKKAQSDKNPLPEECVADANVPPVVYTGSFLAYNAFFSDNRESRVALSLAFATTFTNQRVPPPSGRSNPYPNGYAFTKFYLFRPKLVSNRNETGGSIAYRPSYGIALGTNVAHSPLNELLVGISAGHLMGNMGFIGGMNFFTPNDATKAGRRHRPFLGIDYSF